MAADGLAPSRSNLPHHCRMAGSFAFDGAKAGKLVPLPQFSSMYFINASHAWSVPIQWRNRANEP
jgi:hypothetical protein